jgi:uncharacterized protein (DUF1330 family)
MAVYALNLFDVLNRDEFLEYSRRSVKVVRARGGRVVSLGKFREAVKGELAPRSVFLLIEWASKEAFDGYLNDPSLAEIHSHRENGTSNYIWQIFDKLEDLQPLFNDSAHP